MCLSRLFRIVKPKANRTFIHKLAVLCTVWIRAIISGDSFIIPVDEDSNEMFFF